MLPRDAFPRLIETARLRLRAPDRGDEALCASQIVEAYATRQKPLTFEQGRAFGAFMVEHWSRYGFGFFILESLAIPHAPAPVGHLGFKYVDAWPTQWADACESIELGYSLVPAARGRGYATEGSRAAIAAAFAAFDLAALYAGCSHDNPESAAVMIRIGMTEIAGSERGRRFELVRPSA